MIQGEGSFVPNPAAPGANSFWPDSDVNIPGAASLYQAFLVSGAIEAPFGVKQVGPFAFDLEGDDTVSLENDITDHWLEDNTAAQDSIGVRPVIVTLKGSISELTFSAETSGAISSFLATVESGLSQVDAYLGKYTPGATQKLLTTITQSQNIAVQIQQAAARVAQVANFFAAGGQRNKQQAAFAMLSALRSARTIFTVYTPFQVFSNMAIQSVLATQPSGTKTISNFTVTMKQLQFASELSSSSFLTRYGGRAAVGYQPSTSNGLTGGTEIINAMGKIKAIF